MFKPEFIKRGDGGGGCVDSGTTFASTETIVGDGGSLGMNGDGQES